MIENVLLGSPTIVWSKRAYRALFGRGGETMRVGVEVGGTFTDLVAIGPDGIRITKVPSVPRDPDEGAFNALVESGVPFAAIVDLGRFRSPSTWRKSDAL
jgi:hypothetical protein